MAKKAYNICSKCQKNQFLLVYNLLIQKVFVMQNANCIINESLLRGFGQKNKWGYTSLNIMNKKFTFFDCSSWKEMIHTELQKMIQFKLVSQKLVV
jgi:hypothetical protein